MLKFKKTTLSAALIVGLAGCSSTPEKSPMMTQLDNQFNSLVAQGDAYELAPEATSDAEEQVSKAQKMFKKDADKELLEHQVYLAERSIEIAEETYTYEKEQKYIEQAQLEQKDVLLSAKEREVEQARAGQIISDVEAHAAAQKNAQLQQELEQQSQQLSSSEQEVNQSAQKVEQLNNMLKEMSTKQSDRGLVISVTDIVFSSGNSEIDQDTKRQLTDVAAFLKSYPEREIVVEGYTDSTGSSEFNQNLSKLRAQAVREELVNQGVDDSRLKVKGYGEEFPVADNATEQGRDMNRRVEIVLANSNDSSVEERDAVTANYDMN